MEFAATLPGGATGIYAGADFAVSKIIAIGDSRAGSTVVSLAFERDGLSDLFEENYTLAFEAPLADGRSGIYTVSVARSLFNSRAVAPKPASLGLMLPFLPLAAGVLRQRKRTHKRDIP